MNNVPGQGSAGLRRRVLWRGLKSPWRQSLPDRLVALRERYGDVARLSSLPAPAYLLSHPDSVQYVLRDNAGNYRKGALFRSIALLQGRGLLTSEGEDWEVRRQTAQPAFRQVGLAAAYGAVMTEEARGMVDGWRDVARSGRPVNVAAWMHRLTFRVVGRALLASGPTTLTTLAGDCRKWGDD